MHSRLLLALWQLSWKAQENLSIAVRQLIVAIPAAINVFCNHLQYNSAVDSSRVTELGPTDLQPDQRTWFIAEAADCALHPFKASIQTKIATGTSISVASQLADVAEGQLGSRLRLPLPPSAPARCPLPVQRLLP